MAVVPTDVVPQIAEWHPSGRTCNMNCLIIHDIPSPWREPVFERVYRRLGGDVHVLYFKNNEKRRLWSFKWGSHPKTILRSITFCTNEVERFFNPGIIWFLLRTRPKVALISTSMKDPSAWMAMLLCRMIGTRIALLEDSWLKREPDISKARRLARRIVYNRFGDAFVGSSIQSLQLIRHYNRNVQPSQMFLSHLVADGEHFESRLASQRIEREFDVMFSGRICHEKSPVFFSEVCGKVQQAIGRCRVLVIGDGDLALKDQMRSVLESHGVNYHLAGFIRHEELPDYYARAKLLLLPSLGDCWGVVINEAMLAGTPVITTEMTAAAGELVLHGENGYVLPLDLDTWSEAISTLLSNEAQWKCFSACATQSVANFTFDRAAQGIIDAFSYLRSPTVSRLLIPRRKQL
jgi:glycosyltransferase involved in cell wall biosynthesis